MAKAAATEPKPRKASVQKPVADTAAAPAVDAAATDTTDTTETNGRRRRKQSPMSDAHKEALALGREEGRAIKEYLVAISSRAPRRGRPVSMDSLQRKLGLVQRQLDGRLDPMDRLHLTQRKLDVVAEIDNLDPDIDLVDLEERFIKAAPGYGRRKGLTWSAWRAAGVPAAVLRRAGITRTNY